MRTLLVALLLCAASLPGQANRLLVISIDGLDHRWLRDMDRLGVNVPTLRRLKAEGALAAGVVGVVPTVTWPSHTTMITGMPAWEHGIVSNNQPGQPGQRWWYVKYLKQKTLWQVAHERGLKTAAVWWPVTAGADIDFNFPEFWDDPAAKPRLFAPVERHATPGLTARIQHRYGEFGGRFFADRQKMLAAKFILETHQPDLFLLHLGELDTAQHDTGAFSLEARATLEHQDRLLAELLAALPPRTSVAIVSDHGFETQRRVLRPAVLLEAAGIEAEVHVAEGLFGVSDAKAAAYFRSLIGRPGSAIAREIPLREVRRLAPSLASWRAAFENTFEVLPAAGSDGPPLAEGNQRGYHGLWPTRSDYRACFLLWGPQVRAGALPEISMLDFAATFADILELELPRTQGTSLWSRLRPERSRSPNGR